jgi:hypothetical protein
VRQAEKCPIGQHADAPEHIAIVRTSSPRPPRTSPMKIGAGTCSIWRQRISVPPISWRRHRRFPQPKFSTAPNGAICIWGEARVRVAGYRIGRQLGDKPVKRGGAMAGIARKIESFNLAYQLAWKHISEDQKRSSRM